MWINRMFHLPKWSMKGIYPEEQKVQPAPSFYSATGVMLLKRKPLTSTRVLLLRLCEHVVKYHSRQQDEKMFKKRNNTNCYTQLHLVVRMTGSSFHAHKTMSHFWGPENLTLEHEASRCIVKCCKQYALTASAAQILTTRSSDCAFPATVCGWQRPPSGRRRYHAIWYLPYISVGKQTNEQRISPSLCHRALSIKRTTTRCAVLGSARLN